MQIILKGHAAKRDIYSVPNGVYKQEKGKSPHTDWPFCALVQFSNQGRRLWSELVEYFIQQVNTSSNCSLLMGFSSMKGDLVWPFEITQLNL